MKKLDIAKNAQSNMYAKCGLKIENFSPENKSSEYFAHTFIIKGKNGLFRIDKKTPTKSDWFVTIWKRGSDNTHCPL